MPLLDNDFVAPRDSDDEGDNAQRPPQSDDVPGADNLQIHDNEVCVNCDLYLYPCSPCVVYVIVEASNLTQ